MMHWPPPPLLPPPTCPGSVLSCPFLWVLPYKSSWSLLYSVPYCPLDHCYHPFPWILCIGKERVSARCMSLYSLKWGPEATTPPWGCCYDYNDHQRLSVSGGEPPVHREPMVQKLDRRCVSLGGSWVLRTGALTVWAFSSLQVQPEPMHNMTV